MATKVRKRTSPKKVIRFKRKRRIRSELEGTLTRPRLAVFRSNSHVYAQIIDDTKGNTLVSASTTEKEVGGRANLEGARKVGEAVAKRAIAKKLTHVVFDRSGYLYHGKIKALADAAREAGLKF